MKSICRIIVILMISFIYTLPILAQKKSMEKANLQGLNMQDIKIGETYTIESNVLAERREIFIYKPKNYNNSNKKYPVFYLLDADINFKFTAGMIQYLSSYGMIPEMIVVGIGNVDRTRDMTPNKSKELIGRYKTAGGADKFLSFIETELFPFVNTNFRIQPYKVISGHSLGGLLTCYAFTKKPKLFNAYFSISPSLWWNQNEMIPMIKEHVSNNRFDGYFCLTIADEGGEEAVTLYNDLVLFIKKFSKNEDRVIFKDFLTETHASNAISSTFFGLKDLYKNWSLPFETMKKGLNSIVQHYDNLTKEFKYSIPVPENTLNSAGYNLLMNGKTEAAIEIFEYYVKTNPKSANAYDSLAEAYMKNNQNDLAIKNYKKSLELNPDNTNAQNMLKKLNL